MLFKEAEEQSLRRELEIMAKLWRWIIGLNEQSLIRLLFNEELYTHTFGIFECTFISTSIDDSTGDVKYEFRDYLKNSTRFNNILQVWNEEILKAIHLNYRLLFFKDSVAARWLDETTGIFIENIIADNYQIILDYIFNDVNAVSVLLNNMRPETSFEIKLQTVKFVLDICNASKFIISDSKSDFFVSFMQKGFLSYLYELFKLPSTGIPTNENGVEECSKNSSDNLMDKDNVERIELIQVLASEILVKILQAIPQKFKRALITGSNKLITTLLDIMLLSKIDAPKFEIIEFYKFLLNPEADYLKTDILDLFYEECMPILITTLKSGQMEITSLYLTLDLLTYCVNVHNYRAKYLVIQHSVLNCIEPFYKYKVKYIRVAALKLLKGIIELKDTGIYNDIVTNNSLKSVIEMVEKVRRENLIKSVVLELLGFIVKFKIKILTIYLMEQFPDFVKTGCFSHYPVMEGLYELYGNYKAEEQAQVEYETHMK